MAKPNYAFEKRQKELAKKQKKEEKLKRKTADQAPEPGQTDSSAQPPAAEPPSA